MNPTIPQESCEDVSDRKLYIVEASRATYVVEGRSRRNVSGTTKDDRRGEEANVRTRKHPRAGVDDEWHSKACKPEVLERNISRAGRKESLRSHKTPDNGCVEERARTRAREMARLLRRADTVNVLKTPDDNGKLDEGRPDCGKGLAPEHGSLRDLHVVAEFEILSESKGLGHRDVSVSL